MRIHSSENESFVEMPTVNEQTRLVATSMPGNAWHAKGAAIVRNVDTGQESGPRVKTVLGLSMTAAGVGWVLVDGTTAVDDDRFVVRDPDALVSRCLAAVRGAQSIAASSGRRVDSIGVCWSPDVEDKVDSLLTELRAAGCPDVRSVRQVTPVADQDSEGPVAERGERVDLCGLLAQLLAVDTDIDTDPDVEDVIAFDEHDVTSAPDAGTTSAYDAAQAVVTNAAPPEPVTIVRPRRNWTPAVSGTRIASTAAVTAVIALIAVGSQFVGPADEGVQETAALANRSSDSTAQTSEIVHPGAAAAAPMAAPEPVPTAIAAPPVPLAVPEPVPVVEDEPPVSIPVAEPVAAPQVQAVTPEGVPHMPEPAAPPSDPPAAVPDPAAPIAPPPEVLPPPAPPVPFWLAPPFVPAPPPPPPAVVAPAPEALAAPVEQLPPPAPVPLPAPVADPGFVALP
jgi:hypothetical protein